MSQVGIAVWQRRLPYIFHLMGFGHIKSTYDPLLVMITCGRLWTPIVICTWAEFTLLMMPNREQLLVHNSDFIQSQIWEPSQQKSGQQKIPAAGAGSPGALSLMELHFQENSLKSIKLQHLGCGTSTMQQEKEQQY